LPIVPIRDLGSIGVITDTDPFDLHMPAFTMAVNARFEDKRISRGPIFGTAGTLVTHPHPRFAISYKQLSGATQFLIANLDGTITSWSAGSVGGGPSVETDISYSGWLPSAYSEPYTATINNDVVYVNRPDRVPWAKTKGAASFTALANWDSSWRCKAIRSVGGVIVALNVTKGATAYPTMIKTSDFTVFDAVPGAWTATTTNSATENILADLGEPLIDGANLRQNLILYSNNETWTMQPRGDALMFNYYRTFTNAGVINQNCVAEYNAEHFVFGNDDIWAHDGYQKRSIAAGHVRDFIYGNMVRTQSAQFFAFHNPNLYEIAFCYVSSDPYCRFPVGTQGILFPGCNRAAVYNYRAKTWYFYDLPYVTSAALGVAFTGAHYSDMAGISYASYAGSYSALNDSSVLAVMMTCEAQTLPFGTLAPAVRTFALPKQAQAAGVYDPVATGPVFLERAYLDMDSLGEQQLRGYKVAKAVYPEGRFDASAGPITFKFGSADYPNSPLPVYDTAEQTFDGSAYYKLNFRAAGRYLSMQANYVGQQGFSFSGFDFDFEVTGRR
jgi:hypothetical protein